MGRIRFRIVRFQAPNTVSFFGDHRVPGRELSEFLSRLFMCQSGLTEFFAELTEFAVVLELGEFSRPKQYSRNSIPLVS